MSYQSQISANANAIVLAASTRMVSLCSQASLNILNGIDSKKQFKHADKILRLLQAYSHPSDLLAVEADSILYALRELSDAYTFPTVSPIVGQGLNVQIIVAGGQISFYNQGALLGVANQLDFEGIVAALSGGRVTVSLPSGTMIEIGDFDASANLFPSNGGSGPAGAVQKGNWWNISVRGTLGGESVEVGASIIAKVDAPGQTLANWRIMP